MTFVGRPLPVDGSRLVRTDGLLFWCQEIRLHVCPVPVLCAVQEDGQVVVGMVFVLGARGRVQAVQQPLHENIFLLCHLVRLHCPLAHLLNATRYLSLLDLHSANYLILSPTPIPVSAGWRENGMKGRSCAKTELQVGNVPPITSSCTPDRCRRILRTCHQARHLVIGK
jgi:hypothetical protein